MFHVYINSKFLLVSILISGGLRLALRIFSLFLMFERRQILVRLLLEDLPLLLGSSFLRNLIRQLVFLEIILAGVVIFPAVFLFQVHLYQLLK